MNLKPWSVHVSPYDRRIQQLSILTPPQKSRTLHLEPFTGGSSRTQAGAQKKISKTSEPPENYESYILNRKF